eukprot:487538-Pyramimonas_sp.AAC.1
MAGHFSIRVAEPAPRGRLRSSYIYIYIWEATTATLSNAMMRYLPGQRGSGAGGAGGRRQEEEKDEGSSRRRT